MNCKQGDLAIVVRSQCGNEGRIVRCLELLNNAFVKATNGDTRYLRGDVWRIDQAVNIRGIETGQIRQAYYIPDSNLKPLRGDVTDDEVATTFSIDAKQPA